jgi:predicted AAA+ superfamily ATPase
MVEIRGCFKWALFFMFRFIDLHLKSWSADPYRKPLLLRGARQVGKTFAARELGKNFANFIEINFEELPQLKKLFHAESDLSPQRIIRDLSLTLNIEIIPGKTLLFFDEIQEAPQAIIALRYFYEKMPELHIIAAGSLLDFAIEKVGIPVGRVDFLQLYPMSWIEFLIAKGNNTLAEEILNHDVHVPETELIHHKTLELLREYLTIGGMPHVVYCWINTKDPNACSKIQHAILISYRQDFHKYARERQVKYVESLFDESLMQLGKKFKFSNINGEYRKRELLPALDLLEKANIAYRVTHSSAQGVPIGAQANYDKHKIIFLDVGLSQALLGLNLADWFLNPDSAFVNKGSIIEAFVGQELLAYSEPHQKTALYFWQKEDTGSEAEIDYLIQFAGEVLPIEVKSGKGSSLKSMHAFLNTHPQSSFGIRLSTHNYSVHEKIVSYPLYAIATCMNWQLPSNPKKIQIKD